MHCLFLIIFSLVLVCPETTTATPSNQSAAAGGRGDDNKCFDKERLALFQFKSGLQDPYGNDGCLSTWTAEEADCCNWSGVTCNNQTGHVVALETMECGLVGEISHSLLNLTYLNILDLSHNSFHGTIPNSIGSMTQLKYLDLSYNSFHGTIPNSIGFMTQLKYLDLGYNSFSGTVPPEFGNLTNLQELWLGFVGRCRLENIEWLSHLSLLEKLDMSGISLAKANQWVDVILSLQKLSILNLDGCELSQVMHPYSSSFLNSSSSSSTKFLFLRNNNLNSSMYRWLFPLTSNELRTLDISSNMLDGIPKFLGNLCNLESLYFDNNSAVVEFPVILNNLSGCTSLALQILDVSYNHLTGSLPDEIQKFPSLISLDLSQNRLNGSISEKLWELPNLQTLQLSSNHLRGPISENFGKSKLLSVDLSSNNISGKVPNVSSNLMSLNLSRNNLSGGISFLCQISGWFLQLLDLSQNILSGPIPDCLWHFTELTVLNLGSNSLSGKLPNSAKSLSKLEVMDLYNNEFFGELPLSLQNCTRLNVLNLGANKFFGNVPIWIGENFSGLYIIILTSNKFFGTIPLQLCQLANLQILDLSVNNLHGTIPSCVNNLTAMVQERPTENQNQHSFWGVRGIQTPAPYFDRAMIGWQGVEREFFSNLKLLKMIDLSGNNLTGQIPYEVTNLHELIALNLSKNALHGEIPSKIGQLKNLLALDLSRNKLSGGIPTSMSQKTLLSYLDVSSNNLSGRIPSSTQLQSFDSSRYEGNVGLCGLPLPQKCPGDEEPQVPSVVGKGESDGEDKDEDWGWFYIGIGTGFATGFWIACGALLLNCCGRHAFFFQIFVSFKDWVYVKVVVFVANLKKR